MLEKYLSTEVVCACITLVGVIWANQSAKRIAKDTAKEEMKKLRNIWEHDKEILFEQAFRDMAEAVSTYILNSNSVNQENARAKTTILMAHATGALADKAEALYSSMKCRPSPDTEKLLIEVLHCRRQMQLGCEGKRKRFIFF